MFEVEMRTRDKKNNLNTSLNRIFYFLFVALSVVYVGTTDLYFTHDSFHYMNLSLEPVNGDSHPLLYGFFLLWLNNLGSFLGIQNFAIYSLSFIQSLVALIMIFIIGRNIFNYYFKNQTKFYVITLAFLMILFILIILSFFILKSAVWTEILYMGSVMLSYYILKNILYFFANQSEKSFWSTITVAVFLGFILSVSYHLRYQGTVGFVAILCVGIVLLVYNRKARLLVAGVLLSIIIMFVIGLKLPSLYFQKTEGAAGMTLRNAKTSYFCFWRCQSNIMGPQCGERASEIQSYSCSDVLIGVHQWPISVNNVSIGQILSVDGFLKFIFWIVASPIAYLNDQHTAWGLEIGRFRFVDDDARLFYPKAGAYFEGQYNRNPQYKSQIFSSIEWMIWKLHFTYKVFNILSGLILVLSIYLLFKNARNAGLLFLIFNLFGTTYLFSIFNPHTPWRFLVQLLFLGLLICSEILGSQSVGGEVAQ